MGTGTHPTAPTLLQNAFTLLGFFVPFTFYVMWAVKAPITFATLVMLQVCTPFAHACYRLLGGAASRFVTRLPVWDWLRRDFLVTYAAPGEPGAFEADPTKRYIFCYQPWGVQARGAWYTFAGKGRGSPVRALHDVKLGVSRELWALPLYQQFCALYGCCDSSYRTLKDVLSAEPAQSVCLPLGGYRETKYLRSYDVVAHRRRGFCRLALETGAALVPVVGAGETEFGGAPPEYLPFVTVGGKMTLP
jgi:hypothetical protein